MPSETPNNHQPTPSFLSGPPLAPIGELPPDLLLAFNAAICLIQQANQVQMLLRCCTTQGNLELSRKTVSDLENWYLACKCAIEDVATDLTEIRERSFFLAGISAANAHLGAITYANRVLRVAQIVDNQVTLPDGKLPNAWQAMGIRGHFDDQHLPSHADLAAEIQFEATQAARVRRISENSSGRPNGQRRPLNMGNANDPRDKFCYQKMANGKTRAWIRDHLSNAWEPLNSDQAVTAAAKRYATRHSLPWPLNRNS